MATSLFLSLAEGAALAPDGDGQVVVRANGTSAALKRVTPGLREALERLGQGGGYEAKLVERIDQVDQLAGVSLFYYCLEQLSRRGLLLRSASSSGQRLATLVPTSASFRYCGRGTTADQAYVLSRFAYLHTQEGQMLLESPLAHARLVLHDWRAAALIHLLARPCRAAELVRDIPRLPADAVASLMDLLLSSDMLGEADKSGVAALDQSVVLQSWEFHDLLFHARSRGGRHDELIGGTFRFAGKLDPPPALKSPLVVEFVELARPDLAQLVRDDPPYAHVQEQRRSVRQYGEHPITLEQLGEFLYRVARVKEYSEENWDTPAGPIHCERATRPYPAGGALYELEFYAVVNACQGLDAGLYYYDPGAHGLGKLTGRTAEVANLLRDAEQSTGIPAEKLQILIILSARFQRVSWKYASMAYAVILKHVGVVYQTMYLAATAMGLAPCAVGCGNSDLFARAAGTDYYVETSVGEFLLGSAP
jgi:SagB-type dehydrogenase family enzyme